MDQDQTAPDRSTPGCPAPLWAAVRRPLRSNLSQHRMGVATSSGATQRLLPHNALEALLSPLKTTMLGSQPIACDGLLCSPVRIISVDLPGLQSKISKSPAGLPGTTHQFFPNLWGWQRDEVLGGKSNFQEAATRDQRVIGNKLSFSECRVPSP